MGKSPSLNLTLPCRKPKRQKKICYGKMPELKEEQEYTFCFFFKYLKKKKKIKI